MAIDPESLYLQLRQLVEEMPDLEEEDPISPRTHRWLATASVLVAQAADIGGDLGDIDAISFKTLSGNLRGVLRDDSAHGITVIVHRALARAETAAPAAYRGKFIPVGAEFTSLQVIGKVLSEATSEVLFIDPYMNASVLTDFAPMVPAQARVHVLCDPAKTKPDDLLPAARRWADQFGADRPLEVRMSVLKALHDRFIIIDRTSVWTVTQSLKDLAKRSPASVQKIGEPEMVRMKLDHYGQVWQDAHPLA
jgi:hypothetical protein